MLLVLVNQEKYPCIVGNFLIYRNARYLTSSPDITEVLAAFYQNLTKVAHKVVINSLMVQLQGVISAWRSPAFP